jgi:hypothetical protein
MLTIECVGSAQGRARCRVHGGCWRWCRGPPDVPDWRGRMPAIPAAQFALVEPDFDAATTQGLADPLRRPRVLRGVAQKYSARWLRHGHLTPGPVRCRAGWDACGERHLPLCAQCYSVRQSGRQIAPFTFSPGSARTPQACSLQREWPLSGKLQSHRGRLLLGPTAASMDRSADGYRSGDAQFSRPSRLGARGNLAAFP